MTLLSKNENHLVKSAATYALKTLSIDMKDIDIEGEAKEGTVTFDKIIDDMILSTAANGLDSKSQIISRSHLPSIGFGRQ